MGFGSHKKEYDNSTGVKKDAGGGTVMNADLNGAINIAKKYRACKYFIIGIGTDNLFVFRFLTSFKSPLVVIKRSSSW